MEWCTKNHAALGNATKRDVLDILNSHSWTKRYNQGDDEHGRWSRDRLEFVQNLTKEQIEQNTTWIVTDRGIHPPTNPNYLIPRGYHLRDGETHVLSKKYQDAADKAEELQTVAVDKGKECWLDLEYQYLPQEWSKRKKSECGRWKDSERRPM